MLIELLPKLDFRPISDDANEDEINVGGPADLDDDDEEDEDDDDAAAPEVEEEPAAEE